jgi:metallo-beta-lactamase class B
LAALKKATGAKHYAGAAVADFLARGRISFGPSAMVSFPAVTADRKVHDGDTLSLGGVTLTALATPGHTPGCTSWQGRIDGKMVLFSCSITVGGSDLIANRQYPGITADFKHSFAKLQALKADMLLAPHGFQFDLDAKRARMKQGAPNPFVDPSELARYVAANERDYDHELARQEAAKH